MTRDCQAKFARPPPVIDVFHKKAFRKGRNRLFFYKKRFFP